MGDCGLKCKKTKSPEGDGNIPLGSNEQLAVVFSKKTKSPEGDGNTCELSCMPLDIQSLKIKIPVRGRKRVVVEHLVHEVVYVVLKTKIPGRGRKPPLFCLSIL